MNLPDGWRPLSGVSGSGWDIWLGGNDDVVKPLYALFWRRIGESTNFTMGWPCSETMGRLKIDWATERLARGQQKAEELFAEDIAWATEQEESYRALRALPTFGRF